MAAGERRVAKIGEELRQAMVEAAIYRSKRKAPTYTSSPVNLKPSIGQSILSVICKWNGQKRKLNKQDLKEAVKIRSLELYNERFFETILGGYVARGLVQFDESTGYRLSGR
jgi:hypothetical protein